MFFMSEIKTVWCL